MQRSFLAPILGNSAKASIVQVLAESKPLTFKKLHSEIEKISSKSITYQAIHKAAKEMLDDEILEKHEKEVTINKQWVEKISQLGIALKARKDEPEQTGVKEAKIYIFETFIDMGKFAIRFCHDTPNPENKPGFCIMNHAWPSFGLNKTDYELLGELLKETTYYDLTKNDTPLDKVFGKTLEQLGKKVKVGCNIDLPFDALCKGDQIIQIYYTKEFAEKIDKMFKKFTKIEDLHMNDIMNESLVQKTKIKVIQITDADAADKLREIVIKEFNKK